jgi:hypothetical protein
MAIKKMRILLLFIAVLLSSCIKEEGSRKENVLFDAVSLLGKKPDEVDKILGAPYLIQPGRSKTDPTVKSHWRWYHVQKDMSVFIDEDTADSIAKSITLIFSVDPADTVEAAGFVGIDLTGKRPAVSTSGNGWKEEKYENVPVGGRRITVYFFKDSKSEDTLKVYFSD